MNNRIKELFLEFIWEPSDIHKHLPFLYNVGLFSDTIVELGVREGRSTSAFLAAIQKTNGTLYSVDINPMEGKIEELSKDVINGRYQMNGKWTFIQEDDLLWINRCPNDVDLIFIDTDHTYQQTFNELNLYKTKLSKNGLFICHDTEQPVNHDSVNPIKSAINMFLISAGFGMNMINYPENNGLAIIYPRHFLVKWDSMRDLCSMI